MLSKMRWRFISAAMAAFFAVMLLIVCFINAGYYTVTVSRLDASISMLSDLNAGQFPPEHVREDRGIFENKSPEARYMLRFFAVVRDENGTVTDIRRDFVTSIDDALALDYADKAYGSESGFIREYRYATLKTDGGTVTFFLNASNEQQLIKNLLTVSLGVAVFSLVMVFVLVLLFSGRAILPYAKNLELQRQFITDAGHELKTPLTSITASADILGLEYSDNEWIENIKRQTKRLTNLVSGLVTLSRLDEAVAFPEREPFSFSDLIWEISEPFSSTIKAKGKHFEIKIEDGLMLNGDRDSIGRMISVLLDNAVRYSDDGGIIKLRAYKKGRSSVIEISNTCELPADLDLNKLFDRFYRPDKSRSTSTGGTGIGLSIAKATAEAHGGKISVIRTGKDSICFTVVF